MQSPSKAWGLQSRHYLVGVFRDRDEHILAAGCKSLGVAFEKNRRRVTTVRVTEQRRIVGVIVQPNVGGQAVLYHARQCPWRTGLLRKPVARLRRCCPKR